MAMHGDIVEEWVGGRVQMMIDLPVRTATHEPQAGEQMRQEKHVDTKLHAPLQANKSISCTYKTNICKRICIGI